MLGGIAALLIAMFGDVLFLPGSRVLGSPEGDLLQYFLPSRTFGFGELAKGHLALWNPHIFAGVPYFGGMQSALLYPPNLLFAILPLPAATNWSIVVNVFLLGASMALWALSRGMRPLAALSSAAMLMFCAPHFLHIHGGHLTLMAAMAWAPLIFLATDQWLEKRKPIWCLLGMIAVAMQIFAGSPQNVYIIAIAAGGYAFLRLWNATPSRAKAMAGWLAIYVGGAALAAVQLLTGIEASAETVRGQATPYGFAASFSFPPESLVTFFAPAFFGNMVTEPYWGRWYLWEASAFIGVSGLLLAFYGMAGNVAGKRTLMAVAAACLVLALGDHTPLFRPMFDWFPLYSQLRGTGKFMFPVALLLALFAGYGVDRILRERALSRTAFLAGIAITAALGIGAVVVRIVDWAPVMGAVFATNQSYADVTRYLHINSVTAVQAFASNGLAIAAVVAGLTTLLARLAGTKPAYVVAVLAIGEVFIFARMHRPTVDSVELVIPELRDYLAQRPGDYRILNVPFPNSAVAMRKLDAWGYDPFVSRRYAEFVTWAEGKDPAQAIDYLIFEKFHPLLAMLRVKYTVTFHDKAMIIAPAAAPPLQRLELIGSYQIRSGRDEVFQAMAEKSFDPRREVILEQAPEPAPAPSSSPGRAAVVREGTDFVEILAELASPAILLMTDAWAPGWRAWTVEDNRLKQHPILRADHALRAIALDRGRHYLRLEYAPTGFRIGLVISVAAWIAWLAAILFLGRRKARAA